MLTFWEANGSFVKLTFADFTGTFVVSSDGHGDTLIYDPPATGSSGGSSTATAVTSTAAGVFSTEVHIAPPVDPDGAGRVQSKLLVTDTPPTGGDPPYA